MTDLSYSQDIFPRNTKCTCVYKSTISGAVYRPEPTFAKTTGLNILMAVNKMKLTLFTPGAVSITQNPLGC